MCQIVVVKTKDWNKVGDISHKVNTIMDLLLEKGGDFFAVKGLGTNGVGFKLHAGILTYNGSKITHNGFQSDNKNVFFNFLKDTLFHMDNLRYLSNTLIFFSRQTPALETNKNDGLMQPYYIKNGANSEDDIIFAVHGTIPNTEELEEKYNIELNIDTDIFNHKDFIMKDNDYAEAKGSYVVVKATANEVEILNKGGLGTYEILHNDNELILAMSKSFFDAKYLPDRKIKYTTINGNIVREYVQNKNVPIKHVFLCSGGLDSVCTILKTLNNVYYGTNEDSHNSIDLVYIAWGTRAEEQEIEACEKVFEQIKELFPKITIVLKIIYVHNLFKEYIQAVGYELEDVRLLSKKSLGGGITEAENGSSYVPLRNTFMVNLLAARYEKTNPDEEVNIYLGLNLDDGMAANMLDNTNGWLHCIDQAIKLSGSRTTLFNVKAPYVNKTKSNMIKDVLHYDQDYMKIIFNSFSCYFPGEQGEPCGKCGSCLLRDQAFIRNK